jgi:hypothetical protein
MSVRVIINVLLSQENSEIGLLLKEDLFQPCVERSLGALNTL